MEDAEWQKIHSETKKKTVRTYNTHHEEFADEQQEVCHLVDDYHSEIRSEKSPIHVLRFP